MLVLSLVIEDADGQGWVMLNSGLGLTKQHCGSRSEDVTDLWRNA